MLTASLVLYKHSIEDIQKTLESVLNSNVDFFYIIDNSPVHSIGEQLLAMDRRIKYIPSANNGFGAGHNQGIRESLIIAADFHVIINPDIEFSVGTLENLCSYMQSNPDIGLIMPKTVYPNGQMQYNCKLLPSPMDLIFKRFLPRSLTAKRMEQFLMRFADYTKTMDVPYLCGCFMFFNNVALKDVGLFDERFFMYPEDIDITRRIHRHYRTVYYPEVTVIHAHAAESYKNLKMLKIHIINMIRYFNKWGWIFDFERYAINRKIKSYHCINKGDQY